MPASRARSRSIMGSPHLASARSNSPPTSIDWMPRLSLFMRLLAFRLCRVAPGGAVGEMTPGNVAEGQRRPKRDAGTGIIAAHDARHVVAGGIKPGNHPALRVQRPRILVGDDAGIGAEIADHHFDGVERAVIDRGHAGVGAVHGVALVAVIGLRALAEGGIKALR